MDTKLKKKGSRTRNTIYNFITSIGAQVITVIMQFVIRNVFIHTLGKSYLGISGLFSNILTMLSLAELGVGTAILYKLYEPIANGDHHRITLLMKLYKKIYRVIGLVVLGLGLCVIPFLPFLIKNYDSLAGLGINATLVFLLFLIKPVSSYMFFAYKSAIINAHQKSYIVNLVSYAATIFTGIIQILLLVFVGNFHLYVLTLVVEVVIQNFVCAKISDHMFPYVNEKTTDKISSEEVKNLFKDCGALMLYSVNSVVVKATDNIVLSVFLGLDAVGLYSNYYIFYTTVRMVFGKVFDSVSHSLGDLHASKDTKHEYLIFKTVILIAAILGATAFAGIFAVADEFINQWIGSDWIIPQPLALLMGLELYTTAFRMAISKFRSAMGLFQEAKFRPVAGMIINIVVSVALVNVWGICGVLVGTIASDWLTFMWFDPLIIHKYGLKKQFPVWKYYIKFVLFFFVACVASALSFFACKYVAVGMGWFSIVLHAIMCVIIVVALFALATFKLEEGKYIVKFVQKIFRRKKS